MLSTPSAPALTQLTHSFNYLIHSAHSVHMSLLSLVSQPLSTLTQLTDSFHSLTRSLTYSITVLTQGTRSLTRLTHSPTYWNTSFMLIHSHTQLANSAHSLSSLIHPLWSLTHLALRTRSLIELTHSPHLLDLTHSFSSRNTAHPMRSLTHSLTHSLTDSLSHLPSLTFNTHSITHALITSAHSFTKLSHSCDSCCSIIQSKQSATQFTRSANSFISGWVRWLILALVEWAHKYTEFGGWAKWVSEPMWVNKLSEWVELSKRIEWLSDPSKCMHWVIEKSEWGVWVGGVTESVCAWAACAEWVS